MKRLRADDSADSRVKVGHRQALNSPQKPPSAMRGAFVRLGAEADEKYTHSLSAAESFYCL